MAKIKTFKGNKIGSVSPYYFFSGSNIATNINYFTQLEAKNYALLEDVNSNKLYFANSTNDSVNLCPEFDKELSFSDSFKRNIRHLFSRNMLFTGKPALSCMFAYESTETDEEVYGSTYMNYALKANLDLDQLHSQGNLKTFTLNNVKYTLIAIPNQDGVTNQTSALNTAPGASVILIKGDDLSSAQYIEYKNRSYNFNILSVNTAQKIIYLMGTYEGNTSEAAGENISTNYPEQYVIGLPFNTTEADGVFSFDTEKLLITYTSYVNTGGFSNGAYTSISYLGLDSANNDCFAVLNNREDLANNQLQLVFLRINYTLFPTATTYTALSNQKLNYLNCFDSQVVFTLSANPNTATDYSRQHNCMLSKGWNFDPATPNDYWFYLPLFLNNGHLSPLAIKWDKSETVLANAFTVTEDLLANVSIEGSPIGETSTYIENPQIHLSTLANYAASYEAYIGTHITSDNRIHFLFNPIGKVLYDELVPDLTTKLQNCLSFEVDPNSPTDLTYENIISINNLNAFLYKDYVNSSYNELICLCTDGYKSYFYNQNNGWTLSHHELGSFTEFTYDSYNRRWGINTPATSQYLPLVSSGGMYNHQYNIELHLISQSLPYTTSIAFQNTSQVYAGVALNNNLIVNAYDSNGARIAVDVLLTIEGSNMVFSSNSSTTTVVTTSANLDTIVAVTINGPGYVNVSASFDI